jgi:hypothetical protein
MTFFTHFVIGFFPEQTQIHGCFQNGDMDRI